MAGERQVVVNVSAKDQELIEELLEGSPFKQGMLMSVALRIGLQAIRRDPTVLMPYLGKQSGP